jgi:alkylation response protein AidB-like acyl-CoA dehydrogenase
MDVRLAPETDPRRADVRRFLASNPDPAPSDLAAAGMVAPRWPRPWGMDADLETALIIDQELRKAGVDPHAHNPIGIGWAGPTILFAGTEAQKRRLLPPLLDGSEFWCQLFSEPAAGSDLASLATSAVRDGDVYVVNGQKVWNTYAERADYGILLARTDPAAPRHRGISYFLCPMDLPGIEVRPITQMTGDQGFCEVFFTDVRIPAGLRLGDEGQGWALAKHTLGNERLSLSSGGVLWGQGPRTVDLIERLAGQADPLRRDRAVRLYAEAEVLRMLGLRQVSREMAGGGLGPEVAVRKYLADRHGQRVMNLAVDAMGPAGMLAGAGRDGRDPDDVWYWGFLYSRALTIGGGTTQVLSDIIAELILGLPKT